MKSNTIEITVTVAMDGETRTKIHVIEADTRARAMAACIRWCTVTRESLRTQGWTDYSDTRIDWHAEGPRSSVCTCTARWTERANRLVTDKASYTAMKIKAPAVVA